MQPFPLLSANPAASIRQQNNKTTRYALEEILEKFASNSSLPSQAFLVLLGAVRNRKESDLIHYSEDNQQFCPLESFFLLCLVWCLKEVKRARISWKKREVKRFGASATSMLLLKIYTLLAAIASHTFFKLMFRGCREVGLHAEWWNWTI